MKNWRPEFKLDGCTTHRTFNYAIQAEAARLTMIVPEHCGVEATRCGINGFSELYECPRCHIKFEVVR